MENVIKQTCKPSSSVIPPGKNKSGNRCGHNTHSPRFTLTKPLKVGKKGVPRIITLAVERLTQYYSRPYMIPALCLANDSQRQQRSERREACILVLSALLKYCDITTLTIKNPKDGIDYQIPFRWIAEITELELQRVLRAVKDLKAAGLLTVSQQRIYNQDGTWRGLVAVKAINKNLFAVLGLESMLSYQRKRRSKKSSTPKPKNPTKTNYHRYQQMMESMLNKLDNTHRARSKAPPPDMDDNDRRNLVMAQIAALQAKQPA